MIFLDTETCGLYGLPVLLQYAKDDGPIHLYELWREPVFKTVALLEVLMENEICGFNLAFDAFHLVKLYSIWASLPQQWIPEEHIDEIAAREREAVFGPTLKPLRVCDLLLHARRGKYQCLMARKDIRIRKVPTMLAEALADELGERIELDGILFAKSKVGPKWQVFVDEDNPELADVVLKFKPSMGLKFLAEYALGKETTHFKDIEPPSYPTELGYAPYHDATDDGWDKHVAKHIEHWATNAEARKYATDDIHHTRDLYDHLGRPEPGDDDSELAWCVACVRWRGFEIDIEGIRQLRSEAQAVVDSAPINVNSTKEVRAYLSEVMDEIEQMVIADSTDAAKMEEIVNEWKHLEHTDDTATDDFWVAYCCWRGFSIDRVGLESLRAKAGQIIKNGGFETRKDARICLVENLDELKDLGETVTPSVLDAVCNWEAVAARRAKQVSAIREAKKEVELYDKLLHAGRFHASFNVIGALSGRMSGGDGMNAQGIKSEKKVRKMFPLAWLGSVLSGGDFDSFEVAIALAVYPDPTLKEIVTSGKKVHGYFGSWMYPGHTYEQILASNKTDNDMYTAGKSGFFGSVLYMGDHTTLMRNFSIPEDVAVEAFKKAGEMFPVVFEGLKQVKEDFASISQPDGIGTRVIYKEPSQYAESLLGFRRYFSLENRICRELFELAQSPPKEWRLPGSISRRPGRIQTPGGAVASALYGAAFGIQGQVIRAAGNHKIQSTGAEITKRLQRRLWDLQPVGAGPLLVAPMQVHDEVMAVSDPSMVEPMAEVVDEVIEYYKPIIPLVGMEWVKGMASWAEK